MKGKIHSDKKGVIFDFDDTIANTKPGKNYALKIISLEIHNYLKKEGLNIDFNKLSKTIPKLADRLDNQKIYDRNVWWSFILEKLQLPKEKIKIPKAFLNALTRLYWKAVIKKSALYKDAMSTLNYLKNKGYLLGLLSDTDGLKGMKLTRVKKLNLKRWFDEIVVAGEDTQETKPNSSPFYLISKKLNLQPEKCAFVGNSPSLDIEGARKAKMSAVLMNHSRNKIKARENIAIKKLIKLKEIF